MPYAIEITEMAYEHLEGIKRFYREQIIDAIWQQLVHEPITETKNRKVLLGIEPDFEHVPPVWRLRVGDYRVFYDVNEGHKTVFVRGTRKASARNVGADHMKTVEAGEFAENLSQYLQDSRSETIVVTQAGKPCAVVHGLEYDEEDLQLVRSHEFWSMIRASRQSPTIPWDVAKQRLNALDERPESP